jgi:Trk-type K+ transport system membrane component
MPDPIEEPQHPQKTRERFLTYLRNEVFQLNFYRSHMLYFVVCIAASSVVVYSGDTRISYINALFLCCSAMTSTGLNTVNLGSLKAFQQAVLCVLLVIRNLIFVSTFIVLIRRSLLRK